MVVAGDNLFEFDLNNFLKFARNKGGISIAVHDIGSKTLAKNFGVVKIDADNKVVDFEEKPAKPKSTLISTGIYYFPKSKIPGIVKYVRSADAKVDAPGYYIKWLCANDKVYGFPFSEEWYDIGDLDSYKKADAEYTNKGE